MWSAASVQVPHVGSEQPCTQLCPALESVFAIGGKESEHSSHLAFNRMTQASLVFAGVDGEF